MPETQTIEAVAGTGNVSPVFKLYSAGSDTLIDSAVATEETNRLTVYSAAFTDVAAGTYDLIIFTSGGVPIAIWEVVLTLTTATFRAVEKTTNADIDVDIDGLVAGQAQLIAAITPVTKVYTAQVTSEKLEIIRGDAYDGTSNNSLTWTTSKNINAATGVNFTIRDSRDVVVMDQDTTGVTTSGSGTTVTVSLTSAATDLLNRKYTDYQFDVEVVFSTTSKWTIATGLVCVQKDQSRD